MSDRLYSSRTLSRHARKRAHDMMSALETDFDSESEEAVIGEENHLPMEHQLPVSHETSAVENVHVDSEARNIASVSGHVVSDVLVNEVIVCDPDMEAALQNYTLAQPLEPSHDVDLDQLIADLCVSDSDDGDSDGDDAEEKKPKLKDRIKDWAVKCKTPLSHLSWLLSILKDYHPDLPSDARTLLRTPCSYDIENVANGQFHYFGVKTNVEEALERDSFLLDCEEIHIQFNVDGLPLFKSSKEEFWPILGKIQEESEGSPFVVALWVGKSKPSDSNIFLNKFVEEMSSLQQNGLMFKGVHIKVDILNFVCDTPARAYIKKTKYHNGYAACDNCTTYGDRYMNRTIFEQLNAPERTDVAFDEMIDDEHHTGESILGQLNLKMVSQFPLDYMHLVCLGVMRKLLFMWMMGPLPRRIGSRAVKLISDCLISFQAHMPREFNRKGRALNELERWKATELRTFLLYSGIVALKGKLEEVLFSHFVTFHVAITVLSSKELSSLEEFRIYASKLLKLFAKFFGKLYGREMMVYNVHSLIHLPMCVSKFGPLENFSSFPFENFLKELKSMIRNPRYPLQQVVRRLHERKGVKNQSKKLKSACKKEHLGVLPFGFPPCQQYEELQMGTFFVSIKQGDNAYFIDGNINIVVNIVRQFDNGTIKVLCRKFASKQSFYNYPLDSRKLHIYFVTNLSPDLYAYDVQHLDCKMVLLPHKQGFVSVPILHTTE